MPAEIIDLRSLSNGTLPFFDIPKQILDGLSSPVGEKHLPTILLYDERGLRLYDDITTEAPEYYLFGAEEEILKNRADAIVRAMHPYSDVPTDETILELGAGALRKTSHILLGLSRLVRDSSSSPITYYALDLEQRELERTLGGIEASDIGRNLLGKVQIKGICGTYDEGLKFVEEGGLVDRNLERLSSYQFQMQDGSSISSGSSESDATSCSDSSPPTTPDNQSPPLHIMFLGSSLGNFSKSKAASFLRSLPLRPGSGDTLLLGLDHDNEKGRIEEAYNDPMGYTRRFIMNGLRAAGRALGDETMFAEGKWEYVNRYNAVGRHEAYYKSRSVQTITDPTTKKTIKIVQDEMVKIEQSEKFSETDSFTLFTEALLRPVQRWTDSKSQYSLWLLERPPFSFPLLKSAFSTDKATDIGERHLRASTRIGAPSRQDWENQWAAWDCITRSMIPPSMLFQKPIHLRHICHFYLGHIPTFLDIHLSRLMQEPHTEPIEFKYIFERGIDPNVDDPSECHPHSKVPVKDEDWPTLTAILQFQSRVRARLLKIYDDVDAGKLKMTKRIGRVLFMTLEHEAMHAETLLYMLLQRAGKGTLPPVGFIAPPWTSLAENWDSALPPTSKTVTLGPTTLCLGHDDREGCDSNAPVDLDHEFGWDNEHPQREIKVGQFKIEWRPVTNGEFYKFYLNEGRDKVDLPSSWVENGDEIQVRTLYGPVHMKIAQHWPVITSYVDLSTYATVKGGRLPTEPELRLFYDKFESGYEGGANVGFRNWHPVPATTGSARSSGKGSNGGVWEWTSTVLDKVDGFVPSSLYPGYSMDFFDGKHQVVLGGSYATIPRISERRTFRNWYQRNYPYSWVGGRVAYDIQD
ncbi:hypothetical protein K443DRAFT_97895 [Laccaria amethystina LaAM-08-1]|uniref:DUF323 domain-containing protein n=1 Tax=Laccaria amethystina LaAM-08-1 TaxID=1095629 RepID=A0A0C9Y1D8_9AGAR|nr:hypothetical protein K443DRAFT_97895 [Laccaria amethystina LaAM-08-1]